MIYYDVIYDKVLKPSGIKYYMYGSSILKLPERNNRTNKPLIWLFMYPANFHEKFSIEQVDGNVKNQSTISSIRSGNSEESIRKRIKEYFNPRHGEGLEEVYDHIHDLIKYAAEITILIEDKYHSDKEAFSAKEAEKVEKAHDRYKSVYENYEKEITKNLHSSLEIIISDIDHDLAEDIRKIVYDKPIKGLSLLCTLAMLNESTKKFFDVAFFGEIFKYYMFEMKDEHNDNSGLLDKIIDTAKRLIEDYLYNNSIEIDEDLLPQCKCLNSVYSNLYDCIKKTIDHDNYKHYYVQAVGGNGKTCSLLYLSRKLMAESDTLIPFFIEMRKVDSSAECSLKKYIYHKCTEFSNDENGRFQSVFWDLFNEELIRNDKKLLLILDGCNEANQNCLWDINYFNDLKNIVFVMSSRISNPNLESKLNIESSRPLRLCSLKKSNVERYLKKHNVKYAFDYKNSRLMLPMFVKMIADIGGNADNDLDNSSSIITQAEIIDNWIKWDINHNGEITERFDKSTEIAINCYLPLVSLNIYIQSSLMDHTSMMISERKYLDAIRKTKNILSDEELQNILYDLKDWNISEFDLHKCLRRFAIDKFAYFQQTGNDDFPFLWTHECYRDWFVAKGFDVLRRYAPNYFFEILNTFICDKFKYPEVFVNKDYPTYYIAVYLSELIGESELSVINDSGIHTLIRNIIYFADDLGDYKQVLNYTKILLKRENNSSLLISDYQRANALCGTACANLHIPAVTNRNDGKKISRNAKNMLDGSTNYLESIIGKSFRRVLESKRKNLFNYSPEQMVNLFKSNIKKRPFSDLEEIYVDSDATEYDKYTILACLSRVYSNYWSYYIHEYTVDNDEEDLVDAYESIVLSGLIKYYNWKERPDEVINGKSTQELLAHAFQSIGITLFHARLYKESISYFEYLIDHYNVSEDLSVIIASFMIRSKVYGMKCGQFEMDLLELIGEEKAIVKYFSDNKMLGRLEKTADIAIEMIGLYKIGQRDIIVEKKLNELMGYIEEQYDKYYLDDDFGKKIQRIWKNDQLNDISFENVSRIYRK